MDAKDLGKKFKRGLQQTEAFLETMERKMKDGMKYLTHPKVLNTVAESSLNENMKVNEFGVNFHNINKGYNGEDLDLGEIIFDETFGGEEQAQRQQQAKLQAQAQAQNRFGGTFGANTQAQGDPFAMHQQQAEPTTNGAFGDSQPFQDQGGMG